MERPFVRGTTMVTNHLLTGMILQVDWNKKGRMHWVTVTTRILTFVVGNPHKPSFATVTGRGPHPIYITSIGGNPQTTTRESLSQRPFCAKDLLSWHSRFLHRSCEAALIASQHLTATMDGWCFWGPVNCCGMNPYILLNYLVSGLNVTATFKGIS